ncbi:NAD-dependent epimerase/dehydratase family protein [Burkholderia multivorans]|uniref:NAD-dependent epimerase/dehydratase family protein n=1 Tax=Burkholderia multivorans TaxID=87883 RepID=UPI00201A76C1|nr:NAD-dependent epimerase/dehydratase family protein [Burkholderia multivorans]MCL4654152.1 NAD-dependent epimerase/dehydratase family protein [Burkholderia multivorans]
MYWYWGGEGFIGSHLVEGLVAAGHRVSLFDRGRGPLLPESVRNSIHAEYGDFCDTEKLAPVLQSVDVVYHLISTTLPKSSNDSPLFDVTSNVCGTLNMLEKARAAGVRKVVFVSSGGTVYGVPQSLPISEAHPTEPICSYGITKLAVEKYLHLFYTLYGLDYAVLRVSNPYGDRQQAGRGQGVIGTFVNRIVNDAPIEIWGDGEVIRDYIHVSDVITALLRSADDTGAEKIFNIGSGVGHSLKQILSCLHEITGVMPNVRWSEQRSFDVPRNVLDIARATRSLGWSPRMDLIDGIRSVYESALATRGAAPAQLSR